jgi:hypothetical protein
MAYGGKHQPMEFVLLGSQYITIEPSRPRSRLVSLRRG